MSSAKGLSIDSDLDTTRSCVGVFQHRKLEIIANEQGDRMTAVWPLQTEKLIGDAAKNQVAMNPSTNLNAKRLGRKFDDLVVQSDIKFWPFKVINDNGKPKV